MEKHRELTDTEFIRDFESLSLKPEWFTHEAHLRIAWIYLERLTVLEACEKVYDGICKFDAVFGDGTKHHKTLTYAAVQIVAHFKRKANGDFEALITRFPRLLTNFKDLVAQHYNVGIYNNPFARLNYVEPDKPFD